MPIRFFSEDVDFKPPYPRKTVAWIRNCIEREKHRVKELNYIFCSDEYLYNINVQYLNHRTYTDIITFDSSDTPGILEGDIYISIDRVKENARKEDTSFQTELHRVMIHGVLHLMGYSDKAEAQKSQMRKKEDAYLSLRSFT